MTTTNTNTNQKLRRVANIYDLPLLLQVPGYRLQVTGYVSTHYLVREIAFQKDAMLVRTDSDKLFHLRLGTGTYATLKVEEDPSVLILDYETDAGTSFAWSLCLVPDACVYPDILQALKQVKREED